MASWSSRATARASRCARSADPSAGITFTATGRPRRSSRAAYTVPNPPAPRRAPSRYRPMASPGSATAGSSSVACTRAPFGIPATAPSRCTEGFSARYGEDSADPPHILVPITQPGESARRKRRTIFLSFFDEDDEPRTRVRPRRAAGGGSAAAPDRQTVLIRQLVLFVGFILVLALVIF